MTLCNAILSNIAEKYQMRDDTTDTEKKKVMGEATRMADTEEGRVIMALVVSKVVMEANNRMIMVLDVSKVVMVEEIYHKAASKSF